MIRLPSFPNVDLTSFDLSKLPNVDLPKLPKFDLRAFDLPTFDLPKLDLAKVDDQVVATVKNAAYLTVGLGVAALERLDSARRSANAVASDAVESLTTAVVSGVQRVTKIAA